MADVIRTAFEDALDSIAWSNRHNTSEISLHHCLPNLPQSETDFSVSEINAACTWQITKERNTCMYHIGAPKGLDYKKILASWWIILWLFSSLP